MHIENAVVETIPQKQEQEQKKEPESAPRKNVMKAILFKKGEYTLPNSIVLPSPDVCLLGEAGTVLVPQQNVLPILGVGNKDIRCHRCSCLLAMKIEKPQLQNLAIKCPACGYVNEF